MVGEGRAKWNKKKKLRFRTKGLFCLGNGGSDVIFYTLDPDLSRELYIGIKLYPLRITSMTAYKFSHEKVTPPQFLRRRNVSHFGWFFFFPSRLFFSFTRLFYCSRLTAFPLCSFVVLVDNKTEQQAFFFFSFTWKCT